jgi:hypothetical protein
MFPLRTSATWWHLIAPDAFHLSEFVVDWVWLPRNDPSLFVKGVAQNGSDISPQNWQIMALRVDFSTRSASPGLSKRERCIREFVALARAILGKDIIILLIWSDWSKTDINLNDPSEVAFVGHLQNFALSHVAASTYMVYVGPWNAFVIWCGSLLKPRRPLPADDNTVALYLQSLMDVANSYPTIKSASASIAFFQKLN